MPNALGKGGAMPAEIRTSLLGRPDEIDGFYEALVLRGCGGPQSPISNALTFEVDLV